MLVATFGQSAGCAGKKITSENGQFLLEDHGDIAAADVMEYDRQGQLIWVNDGTRAWVGSHAVAGTSPKPTASSQPLAPTGRLKEAKFTFVNYNGGMSSHPHTEPEGTFVLPSNGEQWELHWGRGNKEYSHGGLASHSIDVEATTSSTCRVTILSIRNPSQTASIELSAQAASDLQAALKDRESKIAPIRAKFAAGSPTQGPTVRPVSFGYAHYLGGHPRLGRKRSGNLFFTALEVGIGTMKPKVAVLQLGEVTSVEVMSGQVATNKVGAEIMFGVLGGLGAKGAMNQATVTLYTKDDQIAYYQVDKKSAAQIRAAITPILRAAGIPFRDEAVAQTQQDVLREAIAQVAHGPQGGSAPSLADELAKLVQLRESGALSDDEFAALKAKMIAS